MNATAGARFVCNSHTSDPPRVIAFLRRTHPMRFKFDVGEKEKHEVCFHFNQWWGNLKITVDGCPVLKQFLLLALSPVRRFEIKVGKSEPHAVTILKWHKPLAPGLRSSRYQV